jgi:hypothetical protein
MEILVEDFGLVGRVSSLFLGDVDLLQFVEATRLFFSCVVGCEK